MGSLGGHDARKPHRRGVGLRASADQTVDRSPANLVVTVARENVDGGGLDPVGTPAIGVDYPTVPLAEPSTASVV